MSVKSLLQLVLFLMIILILGGIYALYFYSNNSTSELSKEVFENTDKLRIENSMLEQEIFEDEKESIDNYTSDQNVGVNNEKNTLAENKANKNNENKSSEEKKIERDLEIVSNEKKKKMNNFTKEIEHITSNKNGDIYKIIAKYGRTNLENTDVLDLEIVNGNILSTARPEVHIVSDFAKYNFVTQDSKFYSNVVVKYDGNTITCDNLDLNIKDNLAVAYNNVIVKNYKSIMSAQTITMDLITKDIKINSNEKVKILSN